MVRRHHPSNLPGWLIIFESLTETGWGVTERCAAARHADGLNRGWQHQARFSGLATIAARFSGLRIGSRRIHPAACGAAHHAERFVTPTTLRLSTELTSAALPAILCSITERNDNEQEEYAHLLLLREPAVWCEAGASAGAEWPWELRSESQD